MICTKLLFIVAVWELSPGYDNSRNVPKGCPESERVIGAWIRWPASVDHGESACPRGFVKWQLESITSFLVMNKCDLSLSLSLSLTLWFVLGISFTVFDWFTVLRGGEAHIPTRAEYLDGIPKNGQHSGSSTSSHFVTFFLSRPQHLSLTLFGPFKFRERAHPCSRWAQRAAILEAKPTARVDRALRANSRSVTGNGDPRADPAAVRLRWFTLTAMHAHQLFRCEESLKEDKDGQFDGVVSPCSERSSRSVWYGGWRWIGSEENLEGGGAGGGGSFRDWVSQTVRKLQMTEMIDR